MTALSQIWRTLFYESIYIYYLIVSMVLVPQKLYHNFYKVMFIRLSTQVNSALCFYPSCKDMIEILADSHCAATLLCFEIAEEK